MVNLGIVGLGPVWECRYRPALNKMRHRVRIRAVFDVVASRCQQAANDFAAVPFEGVQALLTQADVRGILVFDTAWHGNALLHFLRRSKMPAYIAGSFGEDWDELSRLRSLVESEGLVVMPEFSRRFTPATCRLHELIATRLGRPRHISIEATTPGADAPGTIPGQASGTDFLVGLLDWCRYVARSPAVRLETRPHPVDPSSESARLIALDFAEVRGRELRATAELRLRAPDNESAAGSAEAVPLCFTVTCERGEAVIEGPARIRWTVAGGETADESLTADRSEVEVMIDHFCRRLVGGLVPIADISDVCTCLRLVRAAAKSRELQAPVQLADGDGI